MTERTYTNPVYDSYMADPFILSYEGVYYAYGTCELCSDGRAFRVLRSTDLVNWEYCGGALTPIAPGSYWAPAVAFADNCFYLYYSMGGADGAGHRLRVATSPSPLGPFSDCGLELVPDQPFSIDAHPFCDHDGQWYMFYCRDFLETEGISRVGTGIVVDRMLSMTRLSGDPQPVVRPFADWQLFQSQRPMYGQIFDWYTIEGAALLEHHGRYFCFYSGGAWERANYGISYVVADHPLGPFQHQPSAEPILRTVPGIVIGPGHNSFTVAPDGADCIVYHAWDAARTARRMCIDRLRWQADEPRLLAPTYTPQPVFVPRESIS